MMNLFGEVLGVYRRYSLATWLNILGLTLAFTGFYIAVKQTWYEFSYDRSYPDSERVYRLEHISPTGFSFHFVLPMLEQLYRDASSVEAGGIERFTETCSVALPDRPENPLRLELSQINRGYTDVFGFRFTEGSAAGFERKDAAVVIIPVSVARRWFGTDPAVGKPVDIEGERFTVGGVYADFPKNATVKNKIYRPLVDRSMHEDLWGMGNFTGYVKVRSSEDLSSILHSIVYPEGFMDRWEFAFGKGAKARLFPVTDLYFHSQEKREGDLGSTFLLLGVTLLILMISIINFINFSMALAPTRVRSINTQKVLGASVFSLRGGIVREAVFLSLFSFALSLLAIQLISYTSFSELVFFDLSLSYLPGVIGLVAGWAVLMGILAGLSPALYITSVPAAIALKGSFLLSPKGKQLRNLLVGFQFFCAFVLISQTLFIYLQNRYLLETPLGFDKENVVTVELNPYIRYEERESPAVVRFFEQLESYAGTDKVFTSNILVLNSEDGYEGWGDGKGVQVDYLRCDARFTEGLAIPVVEGRPLAQGDEDRVLANLAAKRKYDLKVGGTVLDREIVGFIPDIKLLSFRKETGPMLLGYDDRSYVIYVKLKPGADVREAVAYIRGLLKQIGPSASLTPVRMLDDVAAERYDKERKEALIVGLFCLTCLVITIMGIFGLVVFESQVRRKEIGLRKISGATVGDIVFLLNRSFLFIVLVSFVLSLPVGYYFAARWLDGFVYRIPVYGWIFILSLFFVSVVTMLVVTLQCWRIATSNPVDSLRNE